MRISDWSSDVCSSDLCPFWVEFIPIKKGRKVERVSMMWLPKTMSGRRDAQNQIDQHSIVRLATLRGEIPDMPVLVDLCAPPSQSSTPSPNLTFPAPWPPHPTRPTPIDNSASRD